MSQVDIDIQVGACKLEHDGKSFLDYSYEVRLNCVDMFDKRMSIKSTRTLLDFCDLESRLMKTLVQHNLLSPFHAITVGIGRKHLEMQKQRKDEGGHNLASKLISLGLGPGEGNGTASSSTASELMDNYQYQPIFGGEREQYLKSNFDDAVGQDNLLFKSTELSVWMLQVLQEPNILDAESFGLFFSTEEKCYRRQSLDSRSSTVGDSAASADYEFLLPQKHIRTKTLLSKHTEKIEVQRNQIVLWRFTSVKNDLAFSVDLNGRSLLGAKKYSSSSEEIFGSLEIASSTSGVGNLVGNGLCELKFDNKYAKMMTPTQMKFYCRAVDPAEYVDCKRRASELRETLRRREAALEVVKGIFAPRSAFLRQQQDEEEANAGAGSEGRSQTSAGMMGKQGQRLASMGAGVSVELQNEAEVLALVEEGGAGATAVVQRLLAENKDLRAKNEQLDQKCVQLQSKIDVVLNFTSSSGTSKKQQASTSSNFSVVKKEGGTQHQRRQTYAAASSDVHLTQPITTSDGLNIKSYSSGKRSSIFPGVDGDKKNATASGTEVACTEKAPSDSNASQLKQELETNSESKSFESGPCNNNQQEEGGEGVQLEHEVEVAVLHKADQDSDDEDSDSD